MRRKEPAAGKPAAGASEKKPAKKSELTAEERVAAFKAIMATKAGLPKEELEMFQAEKDPMELIGLSLEGMLPLQYLLGVSTLPFSKLLCTLGSWGSYKTTGTWGIFGRLFFRNSGMAALVETEKKTNWERILSMHFDMPDAIRDRVWIAPANTTEAMLTAISESVESYRQLQMKDPMLIIVDSLGGVTSEAAMEAVESQGLATAVAGHDQQRRARTITEQFRTMPSKFANRNISMIVINHEKEKTGDGKTPSYIKEKTWIGGEHQNFAYAWILTMKRIAQNKDRLHPVTTIRMGLQKSYYSDDRRFILIDFCEEHDLDTNVNKMWVDWDSALINLLFSDQVLAVHRKFVGIVEEEETAEEKKKKSKDEAETASKRTTYGFPCRKLKGLSKAEAGAYIHGDEELTRRVQHVFKITLTKEYRLGKICIPTPLQSIRANAEEAAFPEPAKPVQETGAAELSLTP